MTAEAPDYILDIDDGAKRGLVLLQKLSRGEVPIGAMKMPQREIQQSSGLCFTFVKKVGAGITADWGSGFVLAKIQNADGTSRWSAPLFISVFSGGIGLTLGVSQIDSCIVLDSPGAVASYAKSQFDLSADVTAAGPLGKLGGHDNLSDMDLGVDSFSFSIAQGAIVDFSYKGMRYSLDSAKNLATYGPNVTPQDILEGKVEAPLPMRPLTDALTKFMTEGHV